MIDQSHPSETPYANLTALRVIACWVVIISGLWYLMNVLEDVFKPFFLAVMLGYVILPIYLNLRERVGRIPAMLVMVIGSLVMITTLAFVFTTSIGSLRGEYDDLKASFIRQTAVLKKNAIYQFPGSKSSIEDLGNIGETGHETLRRYLNSAAMTAAGGLSMALVVVLYLVFMLVEAGRFPARLKRAFPQEQMDSVSTTVRDINKSMTEFISGKCLSSFVLAFPVFIVLTLFGVKLAAFWAILTFCCNFIPYIGSVIACGTPLLYAFLTLNERWEFYTLAIILIGIHCAAAMVTEPIILGKAVGLSPLLILLCLTFWGSAWGFVGILLAVPLTAMGLIILRNISATRSIGLLLSDE